MGHPSGALRTPLALLVRRAGAHSEAVGVAEIMGGVHRLEREEGPDLSWRTTVKRTKRPEGGVGRSSQSCRWKCPEPKGCRVFSGVRTEDDHWTRRRGGYLGAGGRAHWHGGEGQGNGVRKEHQGGEGLGWGGAEIGKTFFRVPSCSP